jgi:hypothetical protein
MPGKRRRAPAPQPDIPLFWGLTPNQIVAYNLAQARAEKGWTQDEASAALEPYLGSRWSKANFSAAERSVTGDRVRNFDADEIVAFARAFELPVTYFFMPPVPWADGLPVRLADPDPSHLGAALATMVDVVFGEDHNIGLLSFRLEAFLDHLGPEPVTRAQARVRTLVDTRVGKLLQASTREAERWQTQLHAIANHLEDLVTRAKATTADTLGLPDDYVQ